MYAIVRNRIVMDLCRHSNFDVVAIAASAGGVEALGALLGHLPADFPAPIIVAQHVSPRSVLAAVLERDTPLSVRWAQEGIRPRAGSVLLVPPCVSLVLDEERRCRLVRTGCTHRFDAPDALFSSVAGIYGRRAIAVILTGVGRAGAGGARAIQEEGGLVVAQDPADSRAFSMPAAAIMTGAVALVLPLASIARALVALVCVPGSTGLFGLVPHPSTVRTRSPPS